MYKRQGVSSASVSRILNNDATLNVPQETRQRVFDAAKELGYEKKKKKFDDTIMTDVYKRQDIRSICQCLFQRQRSNYPFF